MTDSINVKMKNKPTVTVIMITYGHENYIEEAIEGVLMQRCNFDLELIISNDKSPDRTDDIIKKIINEHPRSSCVNYIHHEKNLGMMSNFMCTLQQANGKYIAICEGDDYWIDPLKLQKQVDFLEANPDFEMVYSKAKVYSENKKTIINETGGLVSSFHDLLEYNPIPTLTVMFKENTYNLIKEKIDHKDSLLGDLPLWLYLSCYGKIGFIDEITAVYRVLPESASQSSDVYKQIRFLEATHKVRISFLESINAKEYFFKVDKMHYIKISRLRLLPTHEDVSKICMQYFQTNNLKSYYTIEKLKRHFMFSNTILNILYKNDQFLVRVFNKIIR